MTKVFPMVLAAGPLVRIRQIRKTGPISAPNFTLSDNILAKSVENRNTLKNRTRWILQLFKKVKLFIQKCFRPFRPKMLLLFWLNLFVHPSKILSFLNRRISHRKALTLSFVAGYFVLI